MYFVLTQQLKRRVIHELRRYFSYHPKFRDDLAPNIKGEFRRAERPQIGMTVRVGSGNPIQLAADNFKGTVRSYVTLARVPEKPGLFLEWVREDHTASGSSRNFPSPPGVYFIQISEHDSDSGKGQFFVDPLLDIRNELVHMVSGTEGVLESEPLDQTLRLFELPSNRLLTEGVDYEIDPSDPLRFTLSESLDLNAQGVSADYRTPGTSTGPWDFVENRSHTKAIPGCVLAFGRKAEVDDAMVVIVYPRREPAYLEYGGKWDLSVDISIVTRDSDTRDEVTDQTAIYLFGIARSWLSKEGIEIRDVAIGGESEDVYDSGGAEDYYYMSEVTLGVETDWSIFVPLDFSLRSFEESFTTPDGEVLVLGQDPAQNCHFDYLMDPFYRSRRPSTEVIQ